MKWLKKQKLLNYTARYIFPFIIYIFFLLRNNFFSHCYIMIQRFTMRNKILLTFYCVFLSVRLFIYFMIGLNILLWMFICHMKYFHLKREEETRNNINLLWWIIYFKIIVSDYFYSIYLFIILLCIFFFWQLNCVGAFCLWTAFC